ncbi:MAG: NAD(P)-dependent oxidoreductase [Promethearchaeota archaeon]
MVNLDENNPEIYVLFLWDVPDVLKAYLNTHLSQVSNLKLIFPKENNQAHYLKLAPTADVIIGWRPTKELLERAPKLKLYINPGAGVHHLIPLFTDINASRDASDQVILVNGHGNSYFTSQHAVALLLALSNKIIPHHSWMLEGRWRTGDAEAKSIPIWGKKIGLVGYGAINQKVHRLLAGFQCEFSVLRRSWEGKTEPLITPVNKFVTSQIQEFMAQVENVIIALPHTANTVNLIGKKELELLGKSGLLVTVARGIVINEKDLYECLQEKVIAGAAIDVWYEYHPEEDEQGRKYPYTYPFHTLDNVVLSPHRAASPFDDLARWDEVVENLKRLASNPSGTDFLNVVHLDREY